MKKEKGKEKREDIWCIRCKAEGHETVLYLMNTWILEHLTL
jgi:hypothetical protein